MLHRLVVAAILSFGAMLAEGASVPGRISFQGKLIDPATNNPRTGPVNFTFRLCNHPTSGCTPCPGPVCLWSEAQNGVPVDNGVFSVQLGTATPLSPALFEGSSAYLSVTASPDAGEMTPRLQLVMSAYALTASQLAYQGSVRVLAETAYSTFTAGGNLQLPAGLVASTGSFSGSVTASSGSFPGAGGVGIAYGLSAGSATIAGGLTASSGSFTAVGGTQFSLQTSSGILVLAGTLKVDGPGGTDTTSLWTDQALLRPGADPTGSNGMLAYNNSSNRFRCYENGAWRNCTNPSQSVAIGGRNVCTNLGTAYDTTAVTRSLGIALIDFTGATSVEFRVYVQKVAAGASTQEWQLYNETDGTEIGVLADAGAAGERFLSGTFTVGLPTGVKLVRVRTRSTVAADDPVYMGGTVMVNY